MTITYGDAAEILENGVVEVFDAVEYLKIKGADVREGMYGDVYIGYEQDTVAECGNCGRMWDDGISTSWTPVPSGRCPFEYEHEEGESA